MISKSSALVVIDVQVGVVETAYKRAEVIASINSALDKARNAGIPVIWVQHSDNYMTKDSADWKIVPELVPLANEEKVFKKYRSSFVETNLEEILRKFGINHLYICGAETNNCVRHTSHAALDRGFDVTLIEDAHTTNTFQWDNGMIEASSVIDEQNANFSGYSLPNCKAEIQATSELNFL